VYPVDYVKRNLQLSPADANTLSLLSRLVIPHRLSSFTFIASHFISRLLPIMSVKRVLVIAGSDSSGGA
jgi:hypothetical protein